MNDSYGLGVCSNRLHPLILASNKRDSLLENWQKLNSILGSKPSIMTFSVVVVMTSGTGVSGRGRKAGSVGKSSVGIGFTVVVVVVVDSNGTDPELKHGSFTFL